METLVRSSEWLAATLSPDGRVVSLSPGAEKWSGYKREELIGCPIAKILSDSSSFEFAGILETSVKSGFWKGRIVHLSRNGHSRKSGAVILPMRDSAGNNPGYILICSFEETSDAQECTNSRVAEIGDDLRRLAHELNNPLAVTMGFTQLLLLDQNCQDKVRKDIERIYAELKRVTLMVEKLHRYALNLAEKDPAPPATEDINTQASA